MKNARLWRGMLLVGGILLAAGALGTIPVYGCIGNCPDKNTPKDAKGQAALTAPNSPMTADDFGADFASRAEALAKAKFRAELLSVYGPGDEVTDLLVDVVAQQLSEIEPDILGAVAEIMTSDAQTAGAPTPSR